MDHLFYGLNLTLKPYSIDLFKDPFSQTFQVAIKFLFAFCQFVSGQFHGLVTKGTFLLES